MLLRDKIGSVLMSGNCDIIAWLYGYAKKGVYKMLSERLRKYIEKNVKEGDPDFQILYQCLGAFQALEQREEDQAIGIAKKCYDSARKMILDNFKESVNDLDNAVKLTEIMMDYIKNKQRIEKSSVFFDLANKIFESLSSKSPDVPINYANFIKSVANDILDTPIAGIEYKPHEEKMINADDFLNEPPNVTKSSVEMLQKALKIESGDSISMNVLCYDDHGMLGFVKIVKQVLYGKEEPNSTQYVIFNKVEAGAPITNVGLLISS